MVGCAGSDADAPGNCGGGGGDGVGGAGASAEAASASEGRSCYRCCHCLWHPAAWPSQGLRGCCPAKGGQRRGGRNQESSSSHARHTKPIAEGGERRASPRSERAR